MDAAVRYTGLVDYDLRPGGHYRVRATDEFRSAAEAQGFPIPDVVIDGEVIEADPPHKLVTTFRMLMDPELAEAPKLAAMVRGDSESEGAGGGWSEVLSDLKTLLETGQSLNEGRF